MRHARRADGAPNPRPAPTRGDTPPLRHTFKLSGSEDSYFKYSSGARVRSLARCLGTELAEYVVPVPSG